jgi:hypothetical protein
MRPLMHDDALHFMQRWAILVGERGAAPTG